MDDIYLAVDPEPLSVTLGFGPSRVSCDQGKVLGTVDYLEGDIDASSGELRACHLACLALAGPDGCTGYHFDETASQCQLSHCPSMETRLDADNRQKTYILFNSQVCGRERRTPVLQKGSLLRKDLIYVLRKDVVYVLREE